MPRPLILRTLTRDLPDRSRVVAALAIQHHAGNAHPHFSATGEVYDAHGTWSGAAQARNGREPDACGQVDLSTPFPDAATFLSMHLSEYPSGTPIHALANATYHTRGGQVAAAARLLRCAIDELPVSIAAYPAFVDAQAARWAREAADAHAWLTALPLGGPRDV